MATLMSRIEELHLLVQRVADERERAREETLA